MREHAQDSQGNIGKDLESPPLDPEPASQSARELAERLSELSQRLHCYPHDDGTLWRPELGLGEVARAVRVTKRHYPRAVEFGSWRDRIQGFGPGAPQLSHARRLHSAETLMQLGVQAEHELLVELHTDEPTEAQASLLQQKWARRHNGWPPDFRTYYYFDRVGRYAKLAFLPDGIQDPRPSFFTPWLDIPAYTAKTVVSPMTPADFEIAGYALHLLDRRLRALEGLETQRS
jgi:hypothetical protein